MLTNQCLVTIEQVKPVAQGVLDYMASLGITRGVGMASVLVCAYGLSLEKGDEFNWDTCMEAVQNISFQLTTPKVTH